MKTFRRRKHIHKGYKTLIKNIFIRVLTFIFYDIKFQLLYKYIIILLFQKEQKY